MCMKNGGLRSHEFKPCICGPRTNDVLWWTNFRVRSAPFGILMDERYKGGGNAVLIWVKKREERESNFYIKVTSPEKGILNSREWFRNRFQGLSSIFPCSVLFSQFFDIFSQNGKKGSKNFFERKIKKQARSLFLLFTSFPFLFLAHLYSLPEDIDTRVS